MAAANWSPTSPIVFTLHCTADRMDHEIELRSDNAAGAAPEIMAAIAAANTGSALAYGADEWTARLRDTVRAVFDHPDAEVFPVISGTAANSLALAAMCPPWGAVMCHDTAHILVNECGATSMFGGGAMIHGVAGAQYRVDPASLEQAFESTRWGDPHHSQPTVLSLTQPTDYGSIYSAAPCGRHWPAGPTRRWPGWPRGSASSASSNSTSPTSTCSSFASIRQSPTAWSIRACSSIESPPTSCAWSRASRPPTTRSTSPCNASSQPSTSDSSTVGGFWLARPTRLPSLSVTKAIHSSKPRGPNCPSSSA